jgi:uncharacterized protein with PIN domain
MRFLADESCDFNVVRALRLAGYDVIAVSEITPRAEDTRSYGSHSRMREFFSRRTKTSAGWFMPTDRTRSALSLFDFRRSFAADYPAQSCNSSKSRQIA